QDGTGGGTRTLTGLAAQWILNPSRIAISPLRRVFSLPARRAHQAGDLREQVTHDLRIPDADLRLVPRGVGSSPQRPHDRAGLARDEGRSRDVPRRQGLVDDEV